MIIQTRFKTMNRFSKYNMVR